MNEESRSVEKLLATLQPPGPPAGLQERVLSGARDALTREAGRDAWTRIWESRPLRIAWVSAVVVLVVFNIGITELRSRRSSDGTQAARAERRANGELAAIGRLPRLDESARPLIGTETYRVVEKQEVDRALPAMGNRKESAS
jgi:hypothetical protein